MGAMNGPVESRSQHLAGDVEKVTRGTSKHYAIGVGGRSGAGPGKRRDGCGPRAAIFVVGFEDETKRRRRRSFACDYWGRAGLGQKAGLAHAPGGAT